MTPHGQQHVGLYEIKTDHLGQVKRFKARFSAKGCSQRYGIDDTKTFSPVNRMAGIRVMLEISAAMDLELCLMGIDTDPMMSISYKP
jgi:hypothetical protein